jgi:XRE family aerobic/anaerobic benzoate catabolism transcriptional regulator
MFFQSVGECICHLRHLSKMRAADGLARDCSERHSGAGPMSFQPNEQLTAQQSESVDPPGAAAGLDLHTAALLRSLGTRLRQMRKSQGLSRRSLSERSGVSSRYLAKVEAGDGNISIGLLIKLAAALEQPVEHFLMADALFHSDLPHVSQLYARADAAMRARVLQVLDPERMGRQKAQRLCLVGLRGAGKSTLGARIADTFDAPFIELNREIEKNAGMALGEIIALYGQEGYRQLEADTLTAIIDGHSRAVVAVAGGIVSEEGSFYHVLSRFHTVWLKASASEHMERVRAQGDVRPMQDNPQAMIQLRQILRSREAFYTQSDHVLDTSGKSVEQSQSELCQLIESCQILNARAV